MEANGNMYFGPNEIPWGSMLLLEGQDTSICKKQGVHEFRGSNMQLAVYLYYPSDRTRKCFSCVHIDIPPVLYCCFQTLVYLPRKQFQIWILGLLETLRIVFQYEVMKQINRRLKRDRESLAKWKVFVRITVYTRYIFECTSDRIRHFSTWGGAHTIKPERSIVRNSQLTDCELDSITDYYSW